TSKVLTEDNDGLSNNMGIGNLSNLIGVSGRNMPVIETLTPDLYPAIVSNSDFLLELARDQYYFSGLDTTISLVEFFSNFEKENWIKQGVKFFTKLPSLILGRPGSIVPESGNTTKNFASITDSTLQANNSHILSITAAEISAVKKLQERIIVTKLNKI